MTTDNNTPETIARELAEWMGWQDIEWYDYGHGDGSGHLIQHIDRPLQYGKVFNPIRSLEHIALVEAEIGRRGLWREYTEQLYDSLSRPVDAIPSRIRFDAITASAEHRARAALSVIRAANTTTHSTDLHD